MRKKRKTTARKKRRSPAQIRATKKLVALNKRRRKKPVKRKTSAKRKTAAKRVVRRKAVKRNPTRKKRRTIMAKKRSYKKRYTPHKRSYKRKRRNPTGKIADIAINGAIAGVGAVSSLFISKQVSKLVGGSQVTRNLVNLITAVGVGWIAEKYVGGERGKALSHGAVASVVLTIINNSLGLNLLRGDYYGQDEVDEIIESIDVDGITTPDMLGISVDNANTIDGEELLDGEEILDGDYTY